MDRSHIQPELGDINHVAHRDGMREGSLVAGAVLIGGLIMMSGFEWSGIGRFSFIFAVLLLALGAWYLTNRLVSKLASGTAKTDPNILRREQQAQTARAIAEAKASGAFDRFEESKG